MNVIPGGYSKIEFDDNEDFTSPSEIGAVMRKGTEISPRTPTYKDAEERLTAEYKMFIVQVRSADVDSSVSSALARLKAAEVDQTALFFRAYSIGVLFLLTIKNVFVRVDEEYNQHGKLNAYKVTGESIALLEETILSVVQIVTHPQRGYAIGDNAFSDSALGGG